MEILCRSLCYQEFHEMTCITLICCIIAVFKRIGGEVKGWAGREQKLKIGGGICNGNSVASYKSFFWWLWVNSLDIHHRSDKKNLREIKLQFKVISTEGANNPRNRIKKIHSRSAEFFLAISLFHYIYMVFNSKSSRFLLHKIPKHLMKVHVKKCLITCHTTISVNIQYNLYLLWEKMSI